MAADLFRRQTFGSRYHHQQTLEHSLRLAPPGWRQYVEVLHRVVTAAGGQVWQCEPKFGHLAVGLELPVDVSQGDLLRINDAIRAADTTCERCGALGYLRDDGEYWQTLCDACAGTRG